MMATVQCNPRYLIDTNCLVTPYNDYYRPNFSMSAPFWTRLKELVNNGDVGILSFVANEICVGKMDNDFLNDWIESVREKIIDPRYDQSIMATFGGIQRYIANPSNGFSQRAQKSWMRNEVADPWLVAAAAQFNAKIITFEKLVAQVKNQPASGVKIPNVAKTYGVDCISLFDFMNEVRGF